MSHLLVRVQDDLYDAYSDENGLHLPHVRGKGRNTMHFTVDSVVEDTIYGRFNFDKDGVFRGKYVLIADPKEMPCPAGWRQEDSWFRMDAKARPDGTVDQKMSIGHATIVAPEGTPIPPGINAVFYTGGIEERDLAIAQVFEAKGVELHKALWRGWEGYTMNDSEAWARTTAQDLWPDQAHKIHFGTHSGSLDEKLEEASLQERLTEMRNDGSRMYLDPLNGDQPHIERIERHAAQNIALIKDFLENCDATERNRFGDFYSKQIGLLKEQLQEARKLDQSYIAQEQGTYLAQDLAKAPGQGPFFVADAARTGHEQIDASGLAQKLLSGQIQQDQLVWRSGMTLDWSPIEQTPVGAAYRSSRSLDVSPALNAPVPIEVPSIAEIHQARNHMHSHMDQLLESRDPKVSSRLRL